MKYIKLFVLYYGRTKTESTSSKRISFDSYISSIWRGMFSEFLLCFLCFTFFIFVMCVVCFSYFSDRDLCCFKPALVPTPFVVAPTPTSSFHSTYSNRELLRGSNPLESSTHVETDSPCSCLPTSQSFVSGSDIVGKKLARLDYALIWMRYFSRYRYCFVCSLVRKNFISIRLVKIDSSKCLLIFFNYINI